MSKAVTTEDVARLSLPPMEPKDLGGTFSLKGFDLESPKELAEFLKSDKGKALSTYIADQLKKQDPPIEATRDNIIAVMQIEQERQQQKRTELGGKDPKVLHDVTWSHVDKTADRLVAEASKPAAAPAAAGTGINTNDPRHYGTGAAGVSRVEAALKGAGV